MRENSYKTKCNALIHKFLKVTELLNGMKSFLKLSEKWDNKRKYDWHSTFLNKNSYYFMTDHFVLDVEYSIMTSTKIGIICNSETSSYFIDDYASEILSFFMRLKGS